MNIALIGTGNVAVVLSRLLMSAGQTIVEVHGRNKEERRQMAQSTGADDKSNSMEISPDADMCIIAVSDNAIADIVQKIKAPNLLVVHTSGATSKDVLNRFGRHGVLYPLQSLRKENSVIPPIPFFIDANSNEDEKVLHDFVTSTGNEAAIATDEQRLQYHLAAVLCSNFTNHLYALTEIFCKKRDLDFKSLLPLISETANRLYHFSPSQVQTGPAIRHDNTTIQRHLQLLQDEPITKNLYQLLTDSIQSLPKEK